MATSRRGARRDVARRGMARRAASRDARVGVHRATAARRARARDDRDARDDGARCRRPRPPRAPRAAYVHLPFCRSRCYYCDFAISVVGRAGETRPDVDAAMRRYGAATRAEIAATARAMRANGALARARRWRRCSSAVGRRR